MSEPTKDDLLEFMKKHDPESVDSITDKESAIKHFRTSSKLYKHQRDQYKTERENFEQMLNEECERGYQMEGKYHDMKTERDTLIDDLSWYKAKVSRLERENRFLLSRKDNLFDSWRDENKRSVALSKRLEQLERENKNLKNENKAILSQSNSYFDEWQNEQTTSRGLREQCKEYAQDANKYLHLTEHIRSKAECNPSVDRYIELKNFITRLEKGE